MFVILVRVYGHWFIPFDPVEDFQALFNEREAAEKFAERLRNDPTRGYRDIMVAQVVSEA